MKKLKLITSILLIVILSACGRIKEVPLFSLIEKDNILYTKDYELFTGIAYKKSDLNYSKNKSKIIEEKYNVEKGIKTKYLYYDNGKLTQEIDYKLGKDTRYNPFYTSIKDTFKNENGELIDRYKEINKYKETYRTDYKSQNLDLQKSIRYNNIYTYQKNDNGTKYVYLDKKDSDLKSKDPIILISKNNEEIQIINKNFNVGIYIEFKNFKHMYLITETLNDKLLRAKLLENKKYKFYDGSKNEISSEEYNKIKTFHSSNYLNNFKQLFEYNGNDNIDLNKLINIYPKIKYTK